jgi:hypothetical protein
MSIEAVAKRAGVEPVSVKKALSPSAIAKHGGRCGGKIYRWADNAGSASAPDDAPQAIPTPTPAASERGSVNGDARPAHPGTNLAINPGVIGGKDRPPMPEAMAQRFAGE